jgi:hypothetical protein
VPLVGGWLRNVSISGDGRYVGFAYDSSLYVHDRQTEQTYLVDMRNAHTHAIPQSYELEIAAYAPFVVFRSYANNLVAGDYTDDDDVYVNSLYPPALPTDTETLALINPTTNQIALLDSVADPPAVALSFTANPYAGGRWVMGDWDGDGDKRPGVYDAANGAFRFTNDLGPNATWRGIWFGLIGGFPLAGHFNGSLNRDCLGVVDSAEFPPAGTGFALYYTCDLMNGPTPPLEVQWLGVPFPDDAPYQGEIQFAAGAFEYSDQDGLAVRRANHILWSNWVSEFPAQFNNAQGWNMAFPDDAYGTLVAGDWNNDGYDTFGFVFQNGDFYWRNDMQPVDYWMAEGWVFMQHAGQPVGTPIQAASWR